jgi:hypothetical protein
MLLDELPTVRVFFIVDTYLVVPREAVRRNRGRRSGIRIFEHRVLPGNRACLPPYQIHIEFSAGMNCRCAGKGAVWQIKKMGVPTINHPLATKRQKAVSILTAVIPRSRSRIRARVVSDSRQLTKLPRVDSTLTKETGSKRRAGLGLVTPIWLHTRD